MSERQKIKYILSTPTGIDIETVGDRNMKNLTAMLDDMELKISFVREPKIPDNSVAAPAKAVAKDVSDLAKEALETIRSMRTSPLKKD